MQKRKAVDETGTKSEENNDIFTEDDEDFFKYMSQVCCYDGGVGEDGFRPDRKSQVCCYVGRGWGGLFPAGQEELGMLLCWEGLERIVSGRTGRVILYSEA